MPRASIVIPCYNAERFVEATIRSALAQTMDDFEIVCVDDGSTDQTLQILNRLAEEDARIRVLPQANGGEGPARDAGRAAATGDWLYFLDADDLMQPTLLEEAIGRGEQTEADVVVFRTQELDDQTGEIRNFRWCFDVEWLEGIDLFCPLEHPQRIFNSFQNWVHNKVFRGAFVREHGLAFQHVRRSADLLFTCRALSEAARIALLDRPLHLYRVNNPVSALFTSDIAPLDFYVGLCSLREELERRGTWDLFHDSFVNWAQEGVAMNLQRTRSLQNFRAIVDVMRREGIERLDLLGIPHDEAINPNCWERCEAIRDLPLEELLFFYFVYEKQTADELRTECSWRGFHLANQQSCIEEQDRILKQQHEDLHNVLNSSSFRVGRAITSAPRNARDALGRLIGR